MHRAVRWEQRVSALKAEDWEWLLSEANRFGHLAGWREDIEAAGIPPAEIDRAIAVVNASGKLANSAEELAARLDGEAEQEITRTGEVSPRAIRKQIAAAMLRSPEKCRGLQQVLDHPAFKPKNGKGNARKPAQHAFLTDCLVAADAYYQAEGYTRDKADEKVLSAVRTKGKSLGLKRMSDHHYLEQLRKRWKWVKIWERWGGVKPLPHSITTEQAERFANDLLKAVKHRDYSRTAASGVVRVAYPWTRIAESMKKRGRAPRV